ncbi:hypothetical protein C8R46DRAFT_1098217, partial [Mycena filopes]
MALSGLVGAACLARHYPHASSRCVPPKSKNAVAGCKQRELLSSARCFHGRYSHLHPARGVRAHATSAGLSILLAFVKTAAARDGYSLPGACILRGPAGGLVVGLGVMFCQCRWEPAVRRASEIEPRSNDQYNLPTVRFFEFSRCSCNSGAI